MNTEDQLFSERQSSSWQECPGIGSRDLTRPILKNAASSVVTNGQTGPREWQACRAGNAARRGCGLVWGTLSEQVEHNAYDRYSGSAVAPPKAWPRLKDICLVSSCGSRRDGANPRTGGLIGKRNWGGSLEFSRGAFVGEYARWAIVPYPESVTRGRGCDHLAHLCTGARHRLPRRTFHYGPCIGPTANTGIEGPAVNKTPRP